MKDVYIYEEIDDFALRKFTLDIMGEKEVTVHVCSYGGDVYAGLAMYYMLRQTDATVIVEGIAGSIASVILQGAAKGKRIVHRGSMVMAHNPLIRSSGGNAEKLESDAELLRKMESQFVGIYEEATGADREAIKSWMDAETWMTGEEAVNMGFADRIDDDIKMAAMVDITKLGFKNLTMYKETMKMAAENTDGLTPETTPATEPEATAMPEPETVAPVEPEAEVAPEAIPQPDIVASLYTDEQIAEIKKQAILDDIKRQNEIKALAVNGQDDLVNKLIVAHASVSDAALAIARDMKERIMPSMNQSGGAQADLYRAFDAGAAPAMSQAVEVNDVKSAFAKAKGVDATKIYNENREQIIKDFLNRK